MGPIHILCKHIFWNSKRFFFEISWHLGTFLTFLKIYVNFWTYLEFLCEFFDISVNFCTHFWSFFCEFLDISGIVFLSFWTFLDCFSTCGHFWQFLTFSGNFWPFQAIFGLLWPSSTKWLRNIWMVPNWRPRFRIPSLPSDSTCDRRGIPVGKTANFFSQSSTSIKM